MKPLTYEACKTGVGLATDNENYAASDGCIWINQNAFI